MIAGTNLNLRAVNNADLKNILAWVNDPELKRVMGTTFPISDIEHEQWYHEQILAGTNRYFIIELKNDSSSIGLCSLKHFDYRARKVEMTIYIGNSNARRKGYGQEAIDLLLNFVFNELNLHRVHLYAPEYNEDAICFYKSVGFSQEGMERESVYHQGRYWNAIRMSMLEQEFNNRG